jgi:hypothetical protein
MSAGGVWWFEWKKKGGNPPFMFGLNITRCGDASCGDVSCDDGVWHNGDALDSNDDDGDNTCCDGYNHDVHVAFSCASWHDVRQELRELLVHWRQELRVLLHLRQKKLALRSGRLLP